ncbi:MAG TPA: ABC transporter permease [Chthoniobacteraceae bacterium]|nr:ABC transporter permease [Chthoniobacteraceae bacterium]
MNRPFQDLSPPGRKGRLSAAFQIQARVIGALILREIKTRFWRNRFGYLWAFGEPALHLLIWMGVFHALHQNRSAIHGDHPLHFLAMGIIPFFLFRRVAAFMSRAISANQALLDYPLVRHIDLMLARFLLESATMLAVGFIAFLILGQLGIAGPPRDLLGLLEASGLLILLGLGFGAFNAVATMLSPAYDKVLAASWRVLYFTSGIYFLGESLPPAILRLVSFNPVFHGIEAFREAYATGYQSSAATVIYPLVWAAVLLLLGLIMERAARHHLREA